MVGNFFRHYCCPITGQTWTDEMTRMTSSSHTVYWTIWNHVEPEVFHIFLMENCHGKVYPKGQSNMVAMDRFFSHLNAHVWRIFPCHVRLPEDMHQKRSTPIIHYCSIFWYIWHWCTFLCQLVWNRRPPGFWVHDSDPYDEMVTICCIFSDGSWAGWSVVNRGFLFKISRVGL